MKNSHKSYWFNIVLWTLGFTILLFIFSKGKAPIIVDFIYTFFLLIVITIPVNFNFYILVPRLLRHEKHILYTISLITTYVLFTLLTLWLFQPTLDILFKDYFFISYLNSRNIFIVFGIFLVASTLLKLAEDWFYFNKKQNEILKLENQHIQTQLMALRSQINPHFLFNSINVIYAMALEKEDNITTAIVELSDILRYVIYDSDTQRVTLKDEVTLLENYIAFQKHRNSQKKDVSFNVDIENDDYQIYPMLLLPLIENAFKYSSIAEENKSAIDISLWQKEDVFSFTIENLKLAENPNLDRSTSGIGLTTLKENLNLVYPKQHLFKITDSETTFKVELRIND